MPNLFVKNESSISVNKTFGNFCGIGTKIPTKAGNIEGMTAFKVSNNSIGGFGELKYTTPPKNNFAFENRNRIQIENTGSSFTTRAACKYSKNLNDKFNIYEIAGVTTKVNLDKYKSTTITPVSLTGVGYNISPSLNIYGEFEISKSYSVDSNKWNGTTPSCYLGIKYTF